VWHPLIRQQQRNRIAPPLEPLERFQRGSARVSAQYSVALGIAAAKVTLYRTQYFRIVVNRKQYRLRHSFPLKQAQDESKLEFCSEYPTVAPAAD
jgi:hypothetical protein